MPTLIHDLFRTDALTLEAVPRVVDDELYADERAYVARAVEKRRAEFGTARLLVRQALSAMGLPPVSMVPAADRSPVWPRGVTGSISHTRDYCAVVVDTTASTQSVGLDVECIRDVDPSLASSIMTARERAWLEGHPPGRHPELLVLFFSAKEAYYKCQYPIVREYLGFHDVELEIDVNGGRFVATRIKPGVATSVARLEGRFAWRAGKVLCGVVLEA